ncbi:hypothetical protein B0H19DRAFT_1257428 [Mycena capillaripes]|nr:hypothetical protein B0H19DRAFT_1257428 [Mycena capillaripes]
MLLAARACADWSRALHSFTLTPAPAYTFDDDEGDEFPADAKPVPAAADLEAHDGIVHEKRDSINKAQLQAKAQESRSIRRRSPPGRSLHLVLEGPYGGPTLRAGDFERVLLFAGGSGATFTLGVLDELVGRCVRQGRRRGEDEEGGFRSFGAINWFAPYLLQIATLAARPDSHLDFQIRIFVTCLCDPATVLKIPGCTVTEARLSVSQVLDRLLDPVPAPGADSCGVLAPIRGAKDKADDERPSGTGRVDR